MNNFLKVFNEELKKMKTQDNKTVPENNKDDNYLEKIKQDIDNIAGYYEPVIGAIKKQFDNTAEIYKVDDGLAVNYKGSQVISYQLEEITEHSNVPASYRIKISGKLQLPDMLAEINDNGHYYYFEDKNTSVQDNDKDNLVGIPYQDADGVVETGQLERILEKHVVRLARYVGEDSL